MNAQRITMVTLAVADLAASRAFYSKIGFVEANGGNESIAFYKLRGLFFALYSRGSLTKDMGMPLPDRITGASTLATNYDTESEVDTAFEKAMDAGAVSIKAPEKVFWGGYSGLIADPDGHMWEYAHNPYWAFDDDGYLVGEA